jgi:hypothetical protein
VRPTTPDRIFGQPKAIAKLRLVERNGGFGGHAFFIIGNPGMGKTTLAEIICNSIAEPDFITSIHGRDATVEFWRWWFKQARVSGGWLGQEKRERALMVEEADAIRRELLHYALPLIEKKLPAHYMITFTTMKERKQKALFDLDCDESAFMSRLIDLELTNQGVNGPYAEFAMNVAQANGLDGKPLAAYERLLNECGQNLCMALSRIEAGEMLA